MNKTFTTEKGVAYYPYISAPDTKFDEQGHYKVNLCLPKEDAKSVIELINSEILNGIKALKEQKPNKNIKQAPVPYHDELDEETGEPTGNVVIKFKSKAAYKPAVFDSKGNMMTNSNIYGGSVLKVNGSCAFYDSPAVGVGVSLRLRAVQVIQYVEGAQGASKFGFGEEAGFTVSEEVETSEPVTTAPVVEEVVKEEPIVEAPAPAPKPKVVEEPKPAPAVKSEADDLAAEIAKLVGDVKDD